MTESKMNVYQKLQYARVKLQETGFKKTGWNSYSEYKYFELGDFLLPIQTLFASIGLTGIVSYEGDRAFLRIWNNEKPDECIVIESPMSTAKLKAAHEVQNLGAVQTYIRRYLWMTALEIVEHDAIDASKPVEEKLAPAGSARRVTQDVFGEMPPDEQEFLRDTASKMTEHLKEHRKLEAVVLFDALDSDEQTAIFSLFDSQQRAYIKKCQKEIHEKAKEAKGE